MFLMPNQSYLNVWCKDFPEDRILERLGTFLTTVPFSATKPGFTQLTIRAIDATESPLLEQDLRAVPLDAAGIVEIARDHMQADCSCEVHCHWDLWVFDPETAGMKSVPQPLTIFCYGQDYDGSLWRESGHFEAELGFEHFFTGHAGLLGIRQRPTTVPQSTQEAHFLEAMAWPENLKAYQEKTQENIRKLLDWVRAIERAVPVERVRMWSEGEENFEARVEEILAAR
jgi:hypothetical protein